MRLAEKDPKLAEWLDDAEAKGQPVIYFTVGSECKWEQWYVDNSLKGFDLLKQKGVNPRIVWAMKEGNYTFPEARKNDGNHWVAAWLPQVELLAHPAVKIGISHCGFGGTLEFMSAAKPVMTFPHFGDQCINAQNLIDAGAAIGLIASETAERNVDEDNMSYPEVVFTPEHFATSAHTLLTDKKYLREMLRLKCAARAQGGAKRAVDAVESTYAQFMFAERTVERDGKQNALLKLPSISHDVYLEKARSSIGFCTICCWSCWLTIILIYILVWGFPGILGFIAIGQGLYSPGTAAFIPK